MKIKEITKLNRDIKIDKFVKRCIQEIKIAAQNGSYNALVDDCDVFPNEIINDNNFIKFMKENDIRYDSASYSNDFPERHNSKRYYKFYFIWN